MQDELAVHQALSAGDMLLIEFPLVIWSLQVSKKKNKKTAVSSARAMWRSSVGSKTRNKRETKEI